MIVKLNFIETRDRNQFSSPLVIFEGNPTSIFAASAELQWIFHLNLKVCVRSDSIKF